MKEVGTINKKFTVTEENSIKFSEVFKSIFEIKFSERLLNELDYTYEIYQELMEKYDKIDKLEKEHFDKAMCFNETVYLHSMEINSTREKQLLLESLVNEDVRKDSIPYICEKNLKYNNIIIPNIKRLHTILMTGIAAKKSKHKSFRTKNDFFVGYYKDNDNIHVQYFPPLAKKLDEVMDLILLYLNDPELNKRIPNTYIENMDRDFDKKYALFIQPFIVQALLVIAQAFNDGNSRTARVINCAATLNHTNQIFNKNYKLPLLYLSKGYYGFREQYREIIKDVAINPSSDIWNNWLIFSLHSAQSYIESCSMTIDDNKLIKKKV